MTLQVPQDIDLRPLIGRSVLDQGARPTCVPFATSTAHEALRSVQGYDPVHLAPEALWHHSTALGRTSADGMVLRDVDPALSESGQPGLDVWPYKDDLGPDTEPPPPTAGTPPWHRARLAPLTLAHDGMERAVEEALTSSSPVILVVEVTDELWWPGDDGVIAVPNVRAATGGYHAVTCVGAATHPIHGRLLLVKNSWGEGWGLGGYAWLPLGYLVAFAVQAATVLAYEDDR